MDHQYSNVTPARKRVDVQDAAQLDVLGVSRSGRIRKKSSKLMDFESPDDIETKAVKRPAMAPKSYPSFRPPEPEQMQMQQQQQHGYTSQGNLGMSKGMSQDNDSESDYYDNPQDNEERMESQSSDMSEDEDEVDRTPQAPSSSLYMMEKSNKKRLVMKDGRVVGKAKAQRKDKGKSRITAYMMWSKGAREELLRNNPDMDFSAISKRLGEMWQNVNFQERYVWKRKAKRCAMEKDQHENQNYMKMISNAAPVKPSNPVGRPPKLPKPSPAASPAAVVVATSTAQQQTGQPAGAQVASVNGCGPVQVAAHLRLLGENLAIIGERLKEHEGQIAVSGSVSVLLDTALCSLAPLLCVTRCIPDIAPPKELLIDTLNNIAYIMPGL